MTPEESCCAPSSVRRLPTCATPRCACRRACRAPSSKCGSSPAAASTRMSARSPLSDRSRPGKDRDDEKATWSVLLHQLKIWLNQTLVAGPRQFEGGTKITDKVLATTRRPVEAFSVKGDKRQGEIEALKKHSTNRTSACRSGSRTRSISCSAATSCAGRDEDGQGLRRREAQAAAGDKMAGRTATRADLAHTCRWKTCLLADGTSVDVVLIRWACPAA